MALKRNVLILGVPLVGAALVLGALALRRGVSAPGAPSRTARTASTAEVPVPPRAEPRPVPAPEKTVAQESETARIRSTYQNYRTAVATRNATLEKAILPVLLRDRQVALKFAQDDVSSAQSPFDREVAQKVVDALRR